LDVLNSDANRDAVYDQELVSLRKRFAHSMKSSSMMLAMKVTTLTRANSRLLTMMPVMKDISHWSEKLERASLEELQAPTCVSLCGVPVCPCPRLGLKGLIFAAVWLAGRPQGERRGTR